MKHLKTIFIGFLSCLFLALVWAGPLDAPAGPDVAGSAMYHLSDLYNRLDSGDAGTKRLGAFEEPVSAPGSTGYTLDDIMFVAPKVDDDYGASTADVASGLKFWGLTSGQWGLKTGTGTIATYPAPVPKTGQATSYEIGDDGFHQIGVAWPSPRFTDNANGTVTDNLTGLIWLKRASLTSLPESWEEAVIYCNNLDTGYFTLSDGSMAGDWRLPNIKELQSLIDYSRNYPVLPNGHPFTNLEKNYWSSTTKFIVNDTGYAWYVDMEYGSTFFNGKTSIVCYIWPVRGGE